jgi:hypothetical protein
MTDGNGHGIVYDDRYPVTFGDRANEVLTIEAASQMLTDWKREHPEQFGGYLLRTYSITASVGKKRVKS